MVEGLINTENLGFTLSFNVTPGGTVTHSKKSSCGNGEKLFHQKYYTTVELIKNANNVHFPNNIAGVSRKLLREESGYARHAYRGFWWPKTQQ